MSIQSKILTLAFSSSLVLGGAAVTAQQAETFIAPPSTSAQQTGAALEQSAVNNAQQQPSTSAQQTGAAVQQNAINNPPAVTVSGGVTTVAPLSTNAQQTATNLEQAAINNPPPVTVSGGVTTVAPLSTTAQQTATEIEQAAINNQNQQQQIIPPQVLGAPPVPQAPGLLPPDVVRLTTQPLSTNAQQVAGAQVQRDVAANPPPQVT